MKTLRKRFSALHPRAQFIAVTGLRLTICLLFCNLFLLWFGGPLAYATYFNYQIIAAIQDVMRAVLLLSAIGTVWIHCLYTRQEKK